VNPVSHRVDFPGGKTVLVHPVSAVELLELPDRLRLAVVLDRSRSMAERAAEVETAMARLDAAVSPDTTVDIYLTASRYRGEDPARVSFSELDPDSVVYFGGQNAAELLAQFDLLHADQDYDAILVLTDGSGYELGTSDIDVPATDAPVWMVHLDGDFPLGYDDATLEAIQASGGGVTGGIDEAMTRIATAIGADQDASSTDVIDGYTWLIIPSETVETDDAVVVHSPSDDFAALAARRLILDTMKRQRETLKEMSTLDRIHAIAVDQGIVTPYSSMIVLINQAQQNRLDRLEALNDRFQREHEVVGETISQNPFSVTGVPEPEEWLLLVLAAAMLIWYARTRVGGALIHKPGDQLQ
jgi:putative PEP-CTERM system integral membrane protein